MMEEIEERFGGENFLYGQDNNGQWNMDSPDFSPSANF